MIEDTRPDIAEVDEVIESIEFLLVTVRKAKSRAFQYEKDCLENPEDFDKWKEGKL